MDKLTEPLFKKGAEATLQFGMWNGRKAVFKTRLPKRYRNEKMDKDIRTYRTVHEPQLMSEAKRAGVPTPLVFQVDVSDAAIIMEYIEGPQVKQLLGSLPATERKELCNRIGKMIGKLHSHGVIHGDLTTSNMISSSQNRVFLVDFGLGEKSTALEARGVDLHLMKRALQSTHYQFAEECFESILEGYAAVVGGEKVKEIVRRIREIEMRGRYVEGRKDREED